MTPPPLVGEAGWGPLSRQRKRRAKPRHTEKPVTPKRPPPTPPAQREGSNVGRLRTRPGSYDSLAAHEAGRHAGDAHGVAHESALQARHPPDGSEAQLPGGLHRRDVVREEAVEPVGDARQQHAVRPLPALILPPARRGRRYRARAGMKAHSGSPRTRRGGMPATPMASTTAARPSCRAACTGGTSFEKRRLSPSVMPASNTLSARCRR